MATIHVSDDPIVLRPALTAIGTGYDAAPIAVPCNNFNQCVLEIELTLNTATDVRITVEEASPARGPQGAYIAPVAADWFAVSVVDTSTALVPSGATVAVTYRALELVFTTSGRYAVTLPISYPYLRVRAKTTAGPGSTTVAVTGIFGVV